MNFSDAYDTIVGVFKTAWETDLGFDIDVVKWNDVAGKKPASDVPWARVTVQHANGNQSSLAGDDGAQRYDRTGVVIIQVFTPFGDGSVADYSVTQSIVDAYQAFRHPVVWFRNVRMQEAAPDGAFAQTNVLADFTYDDVR